MSKHTPGPWVALASRPFRIGPKAFESKTIADVSVAHRNTDEAMANAALISQVPMLKHWLKMLHGFPCHRDCCDVCNTVSKAEGNS